MTADRRDGSQAHRLETIGATYRAQLASYHAARPDWGTTGHAWAELVRFISDRLRTRDILDYGCGKATLGRALGFPIRGYDPAIPAHSAPPGPADIVVCLDVLEHVEPDRLDAVLDHIAGLTRRLALFVVATRPAVHVLPDGRNAHLIQRPARWWRDRLAARLRVAGAWDLAGRAALFVGLPRGTRSAGALPHR